jgi:hypothetical protein
MDLADGNSSQLLIQSAQPSQPFVFVADSGRSYTFVESDCRKGLSGSVQIHVNQLQTAGFASHPTTLAALAAAMH